MLWLHNHIPCTVNAYNMTHECGHGYLVIVSLEVLYLDSVFIMVRDVMAQSMYGTVVLCPGELRTRGLSPSYTFGPEIDMYTSMALLPNTQPVMRFVKIESLEIRAYTGTHKILVYKSHTSW